MGHDTDCFIGLHDRKICVLGLCHLLQMPENQAIAAHAQQLVPSLILLFDGLKRAYAARNEDDSGDSDVDSDEEEDGVAALHGAFVKKADFRKAFLIFTVMFCHSAAEGIAVGVAFSKQLREQFGIYVSLLLAIHNVPEGLAVALVLVPRGVSVPLAAAIATLTSVPQPLLAVAAFTFVDTFRWLLPLGLAFAAGAMVYVCLHELLTEAAEQLGWKGALTTTGVSFVCMSCVIYALQTLTGA